MHLAQQKCRFFSRASPKQKQSSPQGAFTSARRRRGKIPPRASPVRTPDSICILRGVLYAMHGVHAWVHDSSAQAPGQALPWRPYPPQGPPVGRRRRAARRRRCSPQAPPAAGAKRFTYYNARGARREEKLCPRALLGGLYPIPRTPYPVPMWLRRRRWMAIPHTPGGAGGGVPRSTPYPNTLARGAIPSAHRGRPSVI